MMVIHNILSLLYNILLNQAVCYRMMVAHNILSIVYNILHRTMMYVIEGWLYKTYCHC